MHLPTVSYAAFPSETSARVVWHETSRRGCGKASIVLLRLPQQGQQHVTVEVPAKNGSCTIVI